MTLEDMDCVVVQHFRVVNVLSLVGIADDVAIFQGEVGQLTSTVKSLI